MEGPLSPSSSKTHPGLPESLDPRTWMNGVQVLCGNNLLPVVPKALLNLTEEKNDARVLSVTLATSLPTLGTLEEWAEIPRKPPGQREGYSRICPNSPGHAEVTTRPGVWPSSSPSSLNTAGKTNTPRNPGDPGHVSGRKEELERGGRE